MTTTNARTGLQLRSTVKKEGIVEISLAKVPTPEPKAEEVVVRIDASPINPSDQGLLFGGADMSTAKASGSADNPVVTASISPAVMKAMAGRLGQSLPVGNEGAGVVVQAGASPAAQALMGKTVAILGGAMYSQYRCIKAVQCLVLPAGTTPAEGASCFVNPLTALGMVATMHADVLKKIGATHVCNSSSPTFMDDLIEALVATGATVAFDAIGGGTLAGQILTAMEIAANKTAKEYSRYGSTTHKQVYIYGGLDRGPTEFNRTFGMAWGIGGWLLTPFLQKIGFEGAQKLRERVAAEIKTTFASTYTKEVSLAGALQLEAIAVYGKQATGEKYLINPNKDVRA